MNWRRQVTAVAIVALLVTPTFMPALLAFPYTATAGPLTVRSDRPIDQSALDKVAASSARRVASSPLARSVEPRAVFLTQDGWRWRWLALTNGGAFAVSKPLSEAIIINRADLSSDRVTNGRAVGGARSLSGTLAHEICHGLLRSHFGKTIDARAPAWLREGYCDHVAGESSLSEADAERLRAEGPDHPALAYYEGRQRVAAELARNGGDVDALFAAH